MAATAIAVGRIDQLHNTQGKNRFATSPGGPVELVLQERAIDLCAAW